MNRECKIRGKNPKFPVQLARAFEKKSVLFFKGTKKRAFNTLPPIPGRKKKTPPPYPKGPPPGENFPNRPPPRGRWEEREKIFPGGLGGTPLLKKKVSFSPQIIAPHPPHKKKKKTPPPRVGLEKNFFCVFYTPPPPPRKKKGGGFFFFVVKGGDKT